MPITNVKDVLNRHKDREFMILCPGKEITQWIDKTKEFVKKNNLIVLGSNKVSELMNLDYHIFTNNAKYREYGHMFKKGSSLILGHNINKKTIKRHGHKDYICINFTDRDPNEPISYHRKKDLIKGYYRSSGNLAIMLLHLMGSKMTYIAGMSGFLYKYDGQVHYYKAEMVKDFVTKEKHIKNDKLIYISLNKIRRYGAKFKIITPTIYKKHYEDGFLK